ncbi:MAG: 3-phosphoshikimate 1-carboxyvinyltransferase [PVC group bacterium]|nr:3-phosphoshikimate 1-carboxyvinyltransferase [PVC group bacterium]
MQQIKVKKIKCLKGKIVAPSDKSISQRAVMLGALAKGTTRVRHFLDCSDSKNAVAAFQKMGVQIKRFKDKLGEGVLIKGRGLYGLKAPEKVLYIGNSGTTMRLICGLLTGQKFKSTLRGDKSLSLRPMKRIIDPLRMMGADICGRVKASQEYPPVKIKGAVLQGINYKMPLKSAQVKSAVLLAGLYAKGKTCVQEKLKTRDHTERIFKLFKADITTRGCNVAVCGGKPLIAPGTITIPGDISSSAFFLVAASIIPDSEIIIKNVGLNPTRSYILTLLRRMGANIKILNKENVKSRWEPSADLLISSSRLKGIDISEQEVAYAIDELPILCVAACMAKGKTRIRGASELRVKETDRIYSMVTNLNKMGANIRNVKNDLLISGPCKFKGAVVRSFNDHRTAMCMIIAGLVTDGTTTVKDTECIDKSFPEFMRVLQRITVT